MSDDTFRKRSGTTDQGKDYESLLVAYYSLKLVLNDEILDFKISSNDEKYGNFDDLVIEVVYKDNKKQQFNIQAKHKQTNKLKTLSIHTLAAIIEKFSTKKQLQEFNNRRNETRYIFFTNRPLQNPDDKILPSEETHFSRYLVRSAEQIHLVNTVPERNEVFTVSILEKNNVDKNEEAQKKIEDYKHFYSNFYILINQKNVTEISEIVISLFQDNFKCDDNVAENYIKFIKEWSNRDGKKDKLDKKFLQLKIAGLLLTPFIFILSHDGEENNKLKLLTTAIDTFDITLVSNPPKKNFYKITTEVDLDILNKTGRKYYILSQWAKDISEISIPQSEILKWFLDEQPLMVKVTNNNEASIFQAVKLCCGQKKFILVGTKEHPELKTFRNLSDLYTACPEIYKEIVKNFVCSFNGQKDVSLEEIINNDEKIRSAFSTDELILMLDQNWNFGSPKTVVPDYYIERRLTNITIKLAFIEKRRDTCHVLVSSNRNVNDLKSLLPDAKYLAPECSSLNSLSDTTVDFFGKNVYIVDPSYSKEAFQMICKDNSSPCHHFELDDDNDLLWLQSSRNVNTLVQFTKKNNSFVKEIDILGTSKLNIICADAGMGKSMMMSNLKNKYSSNCWVLKIQLREHTCFFEKEVKYQEFFQYLSKQINLSEFEQKVFDSFNIQKKIILMWDGIDEINREVYENVLQIIKELETEDFVQWITTRSHLKQVLEADLNTLSRKIKPFEREEQKAFIKNRLHDVNFKDAINEILKKVDDEILRIPLQLFMLTELYRKNNTVYKNLLTQKFSIIDLFEFLVEEAFNFYYEKSNIDVTSNNIAKQIVEEHKAQRLEDYQIIALNLYFHPTIVATFKLSSINNFVLKLKREGDCFGIIEMVNNTPSFYHQTYVEYFVALWLSKNFATIENLQNFFFEESFKGVRFMFDLILAKNCLIHTAILHKDKNGVVKNLNQVSLKDEAGRNPLHIASSWGQTHILLTTRKKRKKKIIVNEKKFTPISETEDTLKIFDLLVKKCDIKEKDQLFHFDCFQYADRSLSLAALNSIAQRMSINFPHLQNFKSLESILHYIVEFDYKNLHKDLTEIPYIEATTGASLLHLCAAHDRQQIFPKLIKNKMYIKKLNKKDLRGWTPVHHAVYHGHLEMVKKLKEIGADLHLGRTTGEETPLFVAVRSGHLKVLKYLLKNGGDINISKKDGWTLLLVAVQQGKFKTVNYLVDHRADVNKPNKDGFGPLYIASKKGDLQIVELLISKNASVNMTGRNKETPLYIAANLGLLAIAKVLIQHGANVNIVKNNGWTPLAVAVTSRHLSMVKLLLKNGARWDPPSVFDNFLNFMGLRNKPINPLKVAKERNYSKIEELLIKKEACIVRTPRLDFVQQSRKENFVVKDTETINRKEKLVILSILVILVFVLMLLLTLIS